MESLISFICEHSHDAYWILFCLLLLAGFNVPISEDLLLMTGGIISSTCFIDPSQSETLYLYAWIYAGCWISAWEAYWVGRLLGPRLYTIKWFSHVITKKRIDNLHYYYEKFGILTFIIGRFVPGGVRNALFMTSGLGKMPFSTFLFRDGIACLISSSTLFYLGRLFGENYHELLHYFKQYELVIVILLIIVILATITILFMKKKKSHADDT
jgi:membrane-associated protein